MPEPDTALRESPLRGRKMFGPLNYDKRDQVLTIDNTRRNGIGQSK